MSGITHGKILCVSLSPVLSFLGTFAFNRTQWDHIYVLISVSVKGSVKSGDGIWTSCYPNKEVGI